MIPKNRFAGNQCGQSLLPYFQTLSQNIPLVRPNLAKLAQSETFLPQFVRDGRTAVRYLNLLGTLNWESFCRCTLATALLHARQNYQTLKKNAIIKASILQSVWLGHPRDHFSKNHPRSSRLHSFNYRPPIGAGQNFLARTGNS